MQIFFNSIFFKNIINANSIKETNQATLSDYFQMFDEHFWKIGGVLKAFQKHFDFKIFNLAVSNI